MSQKHGCTEVAGHIWVDLKMIHAWNIIQHLHFWSILFVILHKRFIPILVKCWAQSFEHRTGTLRAAPTWQRSVGRLKPCVLANHYGSKGPCGCVTWKCSVISWLTWGFVAFLCQTSHSNHSIIPKKRNHNFLMQQTVSTSILTPQFDHAQSPCAEGHALLQRRRCPRQTRCEQWQLWWQIKCPIDWKSWLASAMHMYWTWNLENSAKTQPEMHRCLWWSWRSYILHQAIQTLVLLALLILINKEVGFWVVRCGIRHAPMAFFISLHHVVSSQHLTDSFATPHVFPTRRIPKELGKCFASLLVVGLHNDASREPDSLRAPQNDSFRSPQTTFLWECCHWTALT